MEPKRIAEILQEHRRCSCWGENCGWKGMEQVDMDAHCQPCRKAWPCETYQLAAEATRYREALEGLLAWISGEVRDREYRRAWHAYNDTEGGGAEADRLNALHDQREVAIKAAREALATGQEAPRG